MRKIFSQYSIWRRTVVVIVLLAFLSTSSIVPVRYALAQELFQLPQPGVRVGLSSPFMPPLLRGVKVHPDNPFRLDFILDKGNSASSIDKLKSESTRLIKYFLAAITVSEKDLWVNLSPYEKDRIIPNAFGVTEMGRDLLAQDYILKQITASVIYPEEKVGKLFWNKVYAEARKRYGSTDVPIDTFNKVWIVPEKAMVYESKESAYVVESRLKVLLEEDYLALQKGAEAQSGREKAKETNKLGSEIVREVVIPILEQEVNEGKNFAQLRQVYQSLILAIWFKDKIRESLFGKAYVDQEKTGGIDVADKAAKEKIWTQYVVAFKKGAYNYIKEDYDSATDEVVARKYFSGGAGFNRIREVYGKSSDRRRLPEGVSDGAMIVESNFAPVDAAMSDSDEPGINFSISREEARERFVALNNKLQEHGFWKTSANDRFDYLRFLTIEPSWGVQTMILSDKAKEQLKGLSSFDKVNFSDIARVVLSDILDRGEPLPEVRTLNHVKNSPRILLVAPYDKQELKSSSFLAPPLGIYRIANYLKLFGIKCEIFDPNLSGEDKLDELVRDNRYDVVGFSSDEPTMANDIALARRVNKVSPHSILIVGGEGAVFNMSSLIAKGSPFNVLFKGMGEFSLLDFVVSYFEKGASMLDDNEKLSEIKSIAWRDSNGTPRESQLYKKFVNDDYRSISLFFDTSIVPYEEYWEHMTNLFERGRRYVNGVDLARIRTVRLVTESHCPMGCAFCTSTHFLDTAVSQRQKVLSLSGDEIIQVLKNIKKYHPDTQTVFFNDDNFMINKKRVSRFCDLVVREFGSGSFRFIGLGRIDNVDEELLGMMKAAGFVQLSYGIEHFSEKVLRDMYKKVRIGTQIKNLNLTLQAGITPLINLIPFYPTAKIDDIATTIDITVDFINKGALVSYWPFTEAFKGATVTGMGYELSKDGKWILPADARTKEAALKAMEQMPTIRQRIKTQYGLESLSHSVDVLIFFLSFYEAAGIQTLKIDEAIKTEVAKSRKDAEARGERGVSNARLLMPESNYHPGSPLDVTIIRKLVKRNANEAIVLLKSARERGLTLQITGHLRGLDGAGSTLDAPLFQEGLTALGVTGFDQIPQTTVLASDKKAAVRFELASDPDVVEYVAPDYGITKDNPIVFEKDVVLTARGRLPRGQIDAVGYIFRNIFGLKGVRIVMEGISSIALAGGMESSNMFNVALLMVGSMLSGANLSYADIVALAVKLENDEFGGLTGGQGHWSSILGGAQRLIWMSGVKDIEGKFVNNYGVVAQEVLSDEQIKQVEEHTMLVQAGKEYKDGKSVLGRAAPLTNNMWMDLFRYDALGLELHKRKTELARRYAQALAEGDFQTVFEVLNTYVDIRDQLTRRWINLMMDAREGKDVPEYAREFARKVFQPKDGEEAKDYEVIRNLYEDYEAIGRLEDLRHISLYSLNPIAALIQVARQHDIAIFPLGAGAPASNMMAVSPKGLNHMARFFSSQGIHEITDNVAARIVKGTGLLRGYMPFKVGREGVQVVGFDELEGVVKPQLSPKTLVDAKSVNLSDSSMSAKGGVDLTRAAKDLQVRTSSSNVQFTFDSAMIRRLQGASGLTPVITDIYQMSTSVPMFLGLHENAESLVAGH